jgi:5-deoxy-glucuronate isomerase
MSRSAKGLLVKPHPAATAAGETIAVAPAATGFDYLTFSVRRLARGEEFSSATGASELGLVILGGRCSVESSAGAWSGIGGRAHVFDGLPTALYLPIGAQFTVTAETDCEVALCFARAEEKHPARLIPPAEVEIEVRGGANATRQINHILKPEFPAQRLMLVEVYTPSGNWSSYPPHKHDVHRTDEQGNLLEADLEEVYYYKIDRPEGFAFQRIYTDPESPLYRAGYPIDAVVLARNDDAVLIPEGYHPVASPPGYTTYYLNVLAGSAQSLANSEDPHYAWVRTQYRTQDPRVPIYEIRQKAKGKR